MRLQMIPLAVLFLSFSGYAQTNRDFSEPLRVIDAWIDAQKDYQHLPGISVGIVRGDDLLWSKGFGYSDVKHETKATDSTLYSICSISKLFTAIAILQLRDKGKLDLDDPLVKYLPWFNIKQKFPGSAAPTIRSVLTHSSGLPRESDYPYWSDRSFPFPTREQLRRKLPEQEMLYPASSVFQYSNLGMSLLGEIVSVITGKPYEEYIQQQILKPLRLRDTRTELPRELQFSRLATPYSVVSRTGSRDELELFSARGITPAAGFSSNVKDLAKFASWQFEALDITNDPVLNGNTLREMQRVHWMDNTWNNARGLGFELRKLNGQTVVGHSGGCPGYLTQIRMIPEKKLGIVVMVNGLGVDTFGFVEGIYYVLAGYEKEKRVESGIDLEQYSGTYNSFWSGEILIVPWKGKLAVYNLKSQDIKAPGFIMEHVQGDIFRHIRTDGYRGDEIRFERGKDNTVIKYWRHSGYASKIE